MPVKGKKHKDNRGMSFVEILCAVAIFSLISAVVAGVITVSTRIYRNGVSNTSLQQEAQYLSNQIGNMIKDANNISNAGNTYIISTTDAEGYKLEYNSADRKIMYYTYSVNAADEQEFSDAELLSEDVAAFAMEYPDFEKNRAVKLVLQMANDDSQYDMEYTMTARNEVVQSISYNPEATAYIECNDNEVYMVPGETWELPITVTGATGGIEINSSSAEVTIDKVEYTQEETITEIPITLSPAATANSINVTIQSKNKDTSGNPIASETVTIKVRRVNKIGVSWVSNVIESDGHMYEKANTVFTFSADVEAQNTEKRSELWDADWTQPAAVVWEPTLTVNGNPVLFSEYFDEVSETEGATPTIKYKLKKDMTAGMQLTVRATSKHRRGENKNHQPYYDTEGNNVDIYGECIVKPRAVSATQYTVMEPNEKNTVTITGIDSSTAMKVKLIGAKDAYTKATYQNEKLTIILGADETGNTEGLTYPDSETKVNKTGYNMIIAAIYPEGVEYENLSEWSVASKVYIFVRRVTAIDLDYKINKEEGSTIEPLKAGVSYQFRTTVRGTNLDQMPFETESDYKKVSDKLFSVRFDWEVTATESSENFKGSSYWVSDTESKTFKKNSKFVEGRVENSYLCINKQGKNSNGPVLNVKLNKDYPTGMELKVTATALHPKGQITFKDDTKDTNKTKKLYCKEDISATACLNGVIEFPGEYVVADPTQGVDTASKTGVTNEKNVMKIPIKILSRIKGITATIEGNVKGSTKVLYTENADKSGETAYVYIAIDEKQVDSDNLILKVDASAKKSQPTDPLLATIKIPIHIRRVDTVSIAPQNIRNVAGSVLEFTASVAGEGGSNMYFEPHRSGDNSELYSWDKKGADGTNFIGYMTPYAWKWSISFDNGSSWYSFVEDADGNLTMDAKDIELLKYIKAVKGSGIKTEKETGSSTTSLTTTRQETIALTLAEKLPEHTLIKATSLHAAGQNRGGKLYGDVYETYEIPQTIDDVDDPIDDTEIGSNFGMIRSFDYSNSFSTSTLVAKLEEASRQAGADIKLKDQNLRHFFFRWRKVTGVDENKEYTYGEWSQYYATLDNSWTQIKLNANETKIFEPNGRYQCEFALMVVDKDKKIVYWPYVDSLFTSGFEGYTAGWDSQKVTATPAEDYTYVDETYGRSFITFADSSTYTLKKYEVKGTNETVYYTTIGSQDDPMKVKKGDTLTVYINNGNDGNINYRYGNFQDKCTGRAQKWTGSSWEEVDASWFGGDWSKAGIGSTPVIRFTDSLDSGLYRLSVAEIRQGTIKHKDGLWSQAVETVGTENNEYPLCGSNGKAGYIYVNVE